MIYHETFSREFFEKHLSSYKKMGFLVESLGDNEAIVSKVFDDKETKIKLYIKKNGRSK